VRFGLLGTGYWAAQTQGAALVAHPGAELVGVWGRNPAKAGALAEHLGAKAYADVDSLLADVDAVAIAVPPDVQADLAVRAAAAGRHLLLDKPVALTTDAADALVDAVDAAGVASMVFFTNRFVPSVDAFLRAGAASGGWYAARVVMHASIFQPGNPFAGSPWRRERGGLWDIGPHALSIVVPLLDDVVEVTAVDGPRDAVHVIARHAEGAASELSLTLNAAPNATAFESVFYGDAGVSVLPPHDATPVQAFGTAIDQLLALAARDPGDRRHPCDVHFGRTVVRVLAATDTARRERRAVEIA
jgi:predicted dehydrogenase